MHLPRTSSSTTVWKIVLRRHDDMSFRYVETQRHAQRPKIGEVLMVRDIDDCKVRAIVRSLRKNSKRQKNEIFTVAVEEMKPDPVRGKLGSRDAAIGGVVRKKC
jgi:hypothetical protein